MMIPARSQRPRRRPPAGTSPRFAACIDRPASGLVAPLLFGLLGLLGAGGYATVADARSAQSELAVDAGAGAWAYGGERGPAHWAALSAANGACGAGRRQSPIALESRGALPVDCAPLGFRYRSSTLFVKHDGNAVRLGYDRGSFLVVDGLSYELAEVRFHVPAEHTVDGMQPAAEVQLIHGNNRGDIAIVAVPIVAGQRPNQMLHRVLEHTPSEPGKTFFGRNVGINPMFLLPTGHDYYAYEGSLTHPPCTEGVRWFVLRTPLEVDAAEIDRLLRLTSPNARPLQPVGDRRVYRTQCMP